MPEHVLVVDDDHHLLSAFRRQLGDRFDLVTAQGGKEAIDEVRLALDRKYPFAVVLCDMRMPGMDGIETLIRIREIAPDTVRMMLTGNADQQTAVDAVNQGNIFRFYSKPYPLDKLGEGIQAGIDQYRLIVAERELLEHTVTGSIKMLADVISLNDPIAYGLTTRLREWVVALTLNLNMPHRWQLEVAASLASLGNVAIPAELIAKKQRGEALTGPERSVFERAPEVARDLIANIPRLAKVAEIVYLQDRGYDGSGFPPDGPKGEEIPLDARLLKILKDIAEAAAGQPLSNELFAKLAQRKGQYDPQLFARVVSCLKAIAEGAAPPVIELPVASLTAGQVVLSDVRLTNGHLIIPGHTELSQAQIARLHNLRKIFEFVEPVRVRG